MLEASDGKLGERIGRIGGVYAGIVSRVLASVRMVAMMHA
jgi:hypothetical protein